MNLKAPVRCIALALFATAMSGIASVAAADVVAVVSAKSAVTTLSRAQLADLFLGRTNRFPDGTVAVPIDQDEASAIRDEFYRDFAGYSPARVKAHWSKIIFTGRGQPPRQAASADEVKTLVAANSNAIGYVERSAVDSRVRVLATK